MLLLFNFEKKYFDDENIKNTFVGHPLIEKEENVKTVLNDLILKIKKLYQYFQEVENLKHQCYYQFY